MLLPTVITNNSFTSFSAVEGHAKYCDFRHHQSDILYLPIKVFFKMRDSDIHIDLQHVFS